jgi:O-antigen ligase
LCAILLILTDTLIFISGERTALGLLFISTVMIVILVSQFKVFRSITFIFSLIIISIIAISDTKIRERNIDHTINQLGLANDKDEIILFSPVHDSMFRSAWKMFNDSPLFGIGPNNFRIVCEYEDYRINDDTCNTHPHNTFFQIIAETGLFGLMFFLIGFAYLMIIILRQFYSILFKKNSYIDDVQVCIISCMFLSLWPFLPTQDFFNNWINVIYFLPLGFYLFFKNEKNDF